LLRHQTGSASGIIVPPPTDEDHVACFHFIDEVRGEDTNTGLTPALINGAALERNIRRFLGAFDPGFHARNISRDLPHVFFMSTGRVGTMSLYRMFEDTDLMPFHSYWWQNAITSRWQIMCRMISGQFEVIDPVIQQWISTRAAEWLCDFDHREAAIPHG